MVERIIRSTFCAEWEDAVTRLLAIATRSLDRADGQDLLEYALLSSLIALVAFAGVTSVGNAVGNVLWQAIAQNF